METTFNMFDLIFIFSMLILVVIAFFRGFVKEVFALLNWVISLLLSFLLSPFIIKFVDSYSDSNLLVNIATPSIVFTIIFIIVALSTRNLASSMQEKMPSSFDKTFGVIYGIIKTLFIFGFVYSVTVNSYTILLGDITDEKIINENKAQDNEEEVEVKKPRKKKEQMPKWLSEARFLPVIKPFGKLVNPLVKSSLDCVSENFSDKKTDEEKENIVKEEGAADTYDDGETDQDYKERGYSKKEIEKMNRLIEIVK